MPNKSHKNCIEYHKNTLEGKHNYRCKTEFDLHRDGAIHRIDLGCFGKSKTPVALEAESKLNFDNPQVKSNADDLKEFKRIYPNSKTFHIQVDEVVDFDKELQPNIQRPWVKQPVQNKNGFQSYGKR